MHQLLCSRLLELDHLCSRADIDKLHFDFQQCKLHSHHMPIHRKHCNTYESIDYIVVLVDSQYCIRKVHSGIRRSYCMDRLCMVLSGIDIGQCDCWTHKLLVAHNEHLHKLVDIPCFRFVHSFYIFHFRNIQRWLNIDFLAPSGSHFDLLGYQNIQANIDIH